ncbi:MAG: FAD-dependent oxidoreductase, partial [Spirochaetota bacterium]
MVPFDFDIGILGGGSAGLTVAAGAARFGARTLLIEKENVLGGDCLHFGCVPSKTLIKTARVRHLINNAHKFGLPQSVVQPVDFKNISAKIKSVISLIQEHDSVERLNELGAQVEFGDAEFLDDHQIRLGSKKYSAKNWVIATGSSAAIPMIEGLDRTPYLTNRDVFYLDDLPKSLVILGGGPIAIELAQAFCRLGTAVIVIQRSSQILSKEDKDMADAVMQKLSAEGVVFCLNTDVLSTKDLGPLREVVVKSKDVAPRTIVAEALLLAMGREPNLKGLGLEKAGVAFDKTGLILDSRLRTTRKHVFGAGDVTGKFQFSHAAGYEGSVVLANAVLQLQRKVNYHYFPWCTFTDPELANIGMNETAARAAGYDPIVRTEEFSMNDRGLAESEGSGKVKLVLDAREKPLGVQILGLHAGEVISEWIAVL